MDRGNLMGIVENGLNLSQWGLDSDRKRWVSITGVQMGSRFGQEKEKKH
jgi:hypothetical protein